MREVTLGIDTSCYTTSAAFASDGQIIGSYRKLLSVDGGERGLRQSEGVFQHVKALPEVLKVLRSNCPEIEISSVCVSATPRPQADSYMPVFLAGKSFAESIACALGVGVYYTSHQQGHIRAALVDSGLERTEKPFIALHLSGGTTQTVLTDRELNITDIGGTSDLNAGQLVDRSGVYMGLPFPAGPYLEKLACNGKSESLLPVSENKLECSFSGAEAQVKRLLDSGKSKEDVAMEIYSFLSRTIARLLVSACLKTNTVDVLIAGGVASSGLLRELLQRRVEKLDNRIHVYWGKPEYSGDNACGVALIGNERNGRN